VPNNIIKQKIFLLLAYKTHYWATQLTQQA